MQPISEAWSGGSQIWLLPFIKSSRWTQKIDWYLNFQLTRALKYERKDLSPDFLKFISSLGLELDWKEDALAPVTMVLTQGQIPCEAVVMMPEKASNKLIIGQILKILEDLKGPRLRIFPAESSNEAWIKESDSLAALPKKFIEMVEFVEPSK